jgi:transposase
MSAGDKAIILAQVENQSRGKRQALMALGIPKSSYYRWRQGQPDLGNRKRPWNRITPEEEDKVLAVARESPDLSSRQLSTWITDNEGFAVSESTVYRILKGEGLVKRQETQPPDVGYRRFLLPGGWLGLLLPGDRDGRLFPFHPGLEAAERHVG